MIRVFLSSTFQDLRLHRRKVLEALDVLRHHQFVELEWKAMEGFPASLTDTALDEALKYLRLCDIYIGALGPRYGSIEPTTGLSYTEIEYETARSGGIRRGLFLMDKSCDDWSRLITSEHAADLEHRDALAARWQSERLVRHFDGAGDLATQVVLALIPDVNRQSNERVADAILRAAMSPVAGIPQELSLSASASSILSDGSETTTVTAYVSDPDGRPVADREPILWLSTSAVTTNPTHTSTLMGSASTVVTPFSPGVGVAYVTCVALSSGAHQSIGIELR